MIFDFTSPENKISIQSVGGKYYHLYFLNRINDINIPDAFCITSPDYNERDVQKRISSNKTYAEEKGDEFAPTRYGISLSAGNTYDPTNNIGFYMMSGFILYDYEKAWKHKAPDRLRFKVEGRKIERRIMVPFTTGEKL